MERIKRHFEERDGKEALHEKLDAQLGNDPSWNDIAWGELEEEDFSLLEKFFSNDLKEEETTIRLGELSEQGREAPGDASVEFAAMLKNKIISQKSFEKYGGGDITDEAT